MMTLSAPYLLALLACPLAQDKGQLVTVAEAKKDQHGILVHEVRSPYQAGNTEIRVLLPDRLEKGQHYPVVYVLPVEAGTANRYGDGLLEVQKHDLANHHRAIFVAPTFSHMPWYADHPTNYAIRQETYLLKVVLPLVEKTYPVQANADGRLLLGFSKSGWGAYSLLLRRPDLFGRAAAWDAPLMMDLPNRYGMGDIFGSQANFEQHQITRLLERQADELRGRKRLILLGYGNFRDHHQKAHALMEKLKINHEYQDGPARKHEWGSGWLPEAVRLLVAEGRSATRAPAASEPKGRLTEFQTDPPAATETKPTTFNVLTYGAKGDGKTKDTRAIQTALDACHRHGGGTVLFPPGTFLSGSLHLQSGVALHLDHGATLRMSKESADFDPYEKLPFKNDADRETSFFHHALLWAEDVDHIAITGTGTIHGNRPRRGGPKPIALKRCRFVTIQGITILDAPNYAISLLGTDFVRIEGVTILNGYVDAIDPDCCRHMRISNCHIESWDDAIVPKTSFSLGQRRSTENMTVTNCLLASNCNAFKLGIESGGDFRNITVSNCVLFSRPGMRPPVSGISLLSVDGSNIDGMTISNITMTGVRCPLFLRLGNRGRDMEKPQAGTLKNVVISNIVATGAQWPCTLAGIPGHPVEGVSLSNLRVGFQAGGARLQGQVAVPENVGKYPSVDMFGIMPAYGLYCRHAQDIHLANIRLEWAKPDLRHAVVCEDVSNLAIDSVEAPPAQGGQAVLHFHQVRDALLRGCRPGAGTDVFLKVSGAESKTISLMASDFSHAQKRFEVTGDVPKGSVVEVGNRR